MKRLIIIFLICNIANAELFHQTRKPNEEEDSQEENIPLNPNKSPAMRALLPQLKNKSQYFNCEVINENPDAWKWAAGGFLTATAIWVLFFYKKNH